MTQRHPDVESDLRLDYGWKYSISKCSIHSSVNYIEDHGCYFYNKNMCWRTGQRDNHKMEREFENEMHDKM